MTRAPPFLSFGRTVLYCNVLAACLVLRRPKKIYGGGEGEREREGAGVCSTTILGIGGAVTRWTERQAERQDVD